MKIGSIHLFPVVGLPGVSARRIELTPLGIKHDRQFMLIDPNDNHPVQGLYEMAQMIVEVLRLPKGPVVRVSDRRGRVLNLEVGDVDGQQFDFEHYPCHVFIGNRQVDAVEVGREASSWFSEALGQEVVLIRQLTPDLTKLEQGGLPLDCIMSTSFAPETPLTVVSEASLVLLNQKLKSLRRPYVSCDRFSFNIVFAECDAYTEEGAESMKAPGDRGALIQATSRHLLGQWIDRDPRTGGIDTERPIWSALQSIRGFGDKVCLGANYVVLSPGILSVGDRLEFPF